MASVFYFFGLMSAVVAGYFGYEAEHLDVSVGDVANMRLMQIQTLQYGIAFTAAICAAVLLAAGGIVQTMKDRSPDQ